jgi:hypothetical protein
MAATTTLLNIVTPTQGTLSGTWGNTVNNGISEYVDIAIAGTLTLTGDGAVTLANTTGDASATNITSTLAGAGTVTAQFAIVRVSGTTTTKVVTGPSSSKTYVVDNASSFAVTFKASGQAGITVAAAEKCSVYYNGTDYTKLSNTGGSGTFTNLAVSGTTTLSGLTASTALALDASKNVVSVTNTGTGDNVLATSPTLVTPALGTPSSATLTNATGLPVSTGISGLGAGVATFLATPSSANLASAVTDETGTGALVFANSPTLVTPALGTPASGVVTNLTGTASININGTVGATTASTGAFTDVTTSGTVTHNGGTANGVAYLDGSKVLTTGSALTFDGTNLGVNTASPQNDSTYGGLTINGGGGSILTFRANNINSGRIYTTATDNLNIDANGSASGNIIFRIGTGSAEQMRLTSTGLGIGTSSPYGRLTVIPSGTFTTPTDANQITVGESSANAGFRMQLGYMLTGGTTWQGSIQAFTSGVAGNLILNGDGGNVGIGTSSPSFVSGYGGLQINGAGNGSVLHLTNSTTGTTATDGFDLILLQGGSDAYVWQRENAPLIFGTNATERARIDSSGNFLVGRTTAPVTNTAGAAIQSTGLIITESSQTQGGLWVNRITSDGNAVYFTRDNVLVGAISVTGSATTYATSSDYRLKNTITPMTGALAKVALLKPCTYKWNADGSDGEGFIAHELQAVVPQCVTGQKDAVDAEGKPQYQGIDTSFLVATLTAAIQELKAEFDAYKASHP